MKNPQQVADVYLAMFVCTLAFLAAITLLAIFYAFRLFNSTKYHAILWEHKVSGHACWLLIFQASSPFPKLSGMKLHKVSCHVCGSTKFQAMFVGFPYIPSLLAIF